MVAASLAQQNRTGESAATAVHGRRATERAARYPCTRVGPAEAKAFAGLELLGTAPSWQVFGRREQMVCTPADAAGRGGAG